MDYGVDEYIRPEDLHEPILDEIIGETFPYEDYRGHTVKAPIMRLEGDSIVVADSWRQCVVGCEKCHDNLGSNNYVI